MPSVNAVSGVFALSLFSLASADSWAPWSTTSKVPEVKKTTTYDPEWMYWSSTTPKAAVVKTTTYDPKWAAWSTTKAVDPAKTSTTVAWQDWRSSSKPSSTKKPVDPAKGTTTAWVDWQYTTSKKPEAKTTTKAQTWSYWVSSPAPVKPTPVSPAQCGYKTTVNVQSCTTPAASSSCTTFHYETAPYDITTSCVTATPTPACGYFAQEIYVSCGTTSTCMTAAAKTVTTCSYDWNYWTSASVAGTSTSKKADPTSVAWESWVSPTTTVKPVDPATAAWQSWTTAAPVKATTTASCKMASSCTTYHLETAPYDVKTSCVSSCVSTPAAAAPTSSCATYVQAGAISCGVATTTTTITKVIVASSTPAANTYTSTWAAVTTPSNAQVSQCTPVLSTVTNCGTAPQGSASSSCTTTSSCTTYHLEVAPYAATSSCSTTSSCYTLPATWASWSAAASCTTSVVTSACPTATGVKSYTGAAATINGGFMSSALLAAGAIVGAAAFIL